MNDLIGHGNNVSHIIANRLIGHNYCIYPIKVFYFGSTDVRVLIEALKIAYSISPDIVNISYGGQIFNSEEEHYILRLINHGVKVVAAAGNDHQNLDNNCNYYPACYDKRIITVGNLFNKDTIYPNSNYGEYVKKWNIGYNINAGGKVMTGTSQAAAVETSKQALEMMK